MLICEQCEAYIKRSSKYGRAISDRYTGTAYNNRKKNDKSSNTVGETNSSKERWRTKPAM